MEESHWDHLSAVFNFDECILASGLAWNCKQVGQEGYLSIMTGWIFLLTGLETITHR
jgi:hypothetical protein